MPAPTLIGGSENRTAAGETGGTPTSLPSFVPVFFKRFLLSLISRSVALHRTGLLQPHDRREGRLLPRTPDPKLVETWFCLLRPDPAEVLIHRGLSPHEHAAGKQREGEKGGTRFFEPHTTHRKKRKEAEEPSWRQNGERRAKKKPKRFRFTIHTGWERERNFFNHPAPGSYVVIR